MPKRKQIEDGIGFVLKSQRTSASATKIGHVTKIVRCEIPNLLENIERSVWSQKLSPKFEVAGIEFSLFVMTTPCTESISVYLCNESGAKVSVSFSIQSAGEMLSFKKRDYPAHFLDGSRFLTYSNYRKWVEKNGDVLKLKATITVHLEQEPKEVNLSLGKMIMKDDATTDLTIVCMTKSFRVHKAILCARSPVWRAIIMDKRRRGEQINVSTDEVTLGSIITYMYTGELPDTHDFDVEKMIYAANKGRIQSNISYVFSFFKAKRNRILN